MKTIDTQISDTLKLFVRNQGSLFQHFCFIRHFGTLRGADESLTIEKKQLQAEGIKELLQTQILTYFEDIRIIPELEAKSLSKGYHEITCSCISWKCSVTGM